MSIYKITYCAATENMGNTTEADANNYRAWAAREIAAACPDAHIEVLDDVNQSCAQSDAEDCEVAYKEEQEAIELLAALWDRCPWSGVEFE